MHCTQKIIHRLYRSVYKPIAVRLRLAVVRSKLWLAGVTFGKYLFVEGAVDVDDGTKIVMGDHVHLGKNVYLGVFSCGQLKIGSHTYIGRYSTILAYESVEIGSNCLIAPQAHITDVNHSFDDVNKPIRLQPYTSKKVVIEDDVWLGGGVSVLPGVRIGHGSVIGARAVVTKDIPPNSIAAGIPAKVIRNRFVPSATKRK